MANELLTRMTGKALPGQVPLLDLGGGWWFVVSTLTLAVVWGLVTFGISLTPSAGLWNLLLIPAIVIAEVVLVGRLRAQQVVFGHHAVHGTLSPSWPWLNAFCKRFATIIPLAQNPDDYRAEHVGMHHRRNFFTTTSDPDAAFLHILGFVPGMSRAEYYALLWRTIFSPRFHYLFLQARVRSAFVKSDKLHRLLAALWVSVLTGVATHMPAWTFLAAVVLPMGPLYHTSALLQFLTEHRWMMTKDGPKTQAEYEARCVGRFTLVPPPQAPITVASLPAWSLWALRMIPEVLVRLGVWVGDLPAHDHHHVVGHVGHDPHDWHEALFERQRSIDDGDPAGLGDREVYGLKAALDWVFDGLAFGQK